MAVAGASRLAFITTLSTVGKANASCCPLRPRTTPFPEENAILGVIYGFLLCAEMNAATPLGPRGRSVMPLGGFTWDGDNSQTVYQNTIDLVGGGKSLIP